jgi:hypothetical protein
MCRLGRCHLYQPKGYHRAVSPDPEDEIAILPSVNVVVWLGQAADGSDDAIDFINTIADVWNLAGISDVMRHHLRRQMDA